LAPIEETKIGNQPQAAAQNGGLYVHIPFCQKKCAYCDFYSVTDRKFIPPFLDALIAEMRLKQAAAPTVDTLYIGGGTPSVLDTEQIGRLIRTAMRTFNIPPDAEITLEVNPGTTDAIRMMEFRTSGVNRINIGVQSFSDGILDFLGRIHTGREGRLAVASAQKAGFDQIGLDLIYGIPGQTRESWLADLLKAVEMAPDHLSCYLLTIEPGTPLAGDFRSRRFEAMPEQTVADLFEVTQSFLQSMGYIQYEISNFARSNGAKSRHNLKYWTYAPYDGLGPAAHSFRLPVRWWNHRSVEKYIRDIEKGAVPVAGKEVLGREQQIIETIYLGLRTAGGVEIADFNRRFKADFNTKFSEAVDVLQTEGMLSQTRERCTLTKKGVRFHESIAKMLIEYV